MLRYIVKRIMAAAPLLCLVCVLCFTLIQLAPFDAIDMLARPDMSAEVIEAIKVREGLDKPGYLQFFHWLKRMVSGDLGYSIVNHQSVALGLASRLPNTLVLVLPSYAFAVSLAVILGLIAGSSEGSRLDKFIDGFCSIGMATPTFWIGLILIYICSYRLNLFPVLGMYTVGMEPNLADALRHLTLPWITLIIAFLPDMVRYVRSSAIGQWREDYVMVQKAFGASKKEILFRHVIKNVLLPVITLVGMSLPMLITGAFITESIFSWPGVGVYFLTAIQAFDYPIVMAITLFSSIMVILGNLLADICYGLADPRIKTVRSN
ncbi:MAG: ABC transporter permease [Treponema sp.]|jgi:peptide/nickel transport system permease protein|nr:ABC transporter permease [Treponema sp.]